ncbi:MAG: DUF4294 domain-containing protein [Bacteroidales bacterium]
MKRHNINLYSIIIVLFLTSLTPLFSQNTDDVIKPKTENPFIVEIGPIIGEDTIYIFTLPEVEIIGRRNFKNKWDERRYTRLYHNIKKVYPYAKLAGEKLTLYAPILDSLETKSERDKYFSIIEDELWAEFGDDLKKLTYKQGAILIKLVDRECQRSSYQVIKDFRGGFSAFFYQVLARIWGYNLKQSYDPNGADADIEEIVRLIELGKL